MHTFWVVMKLELLLIWRNWATWLIALAMLFIGLLAAVNNRNQPWSIWGQSVTVGLFITLILTFSTGNQMNRDRERRLDGVIFSTPIKTSVYVLAKYGASLLSLLALTSLSLLTTLFTDQFYSIPSQVLFLSPAIYPPLGFQVYLQDLIWVLLVPVLFGATFMFACTTLTRDKRAIAYIATALIWLIPYFAIHSNGSFIDIGGLSFAVGSTPATIFWFLHHAGSQSSLQMAQFTSQIMPLARAEMPPASLLNTLLWNRLLFLGLTLILLFLTVLIVQRTRRNA